MTHDRQFLGSAGFGGAAGAGAELCVSEVGSSDGVEDFEDPLLALGVAFRVFAEGEADDGPEAGAPAEWGALSPPAVTSDDMRPGHSHAPPLASAASVTTAMEAIQTGPGLPLRGRSATVGAG
ncbi:hypothetical protein [Streptomyces puniciscabiei]|uniref:hypothetical protein n=1 Tax=Streptomyces puniciscabiei TaxID=164348 RepID=UPI0037BD5DED